MAALNCDEIRDLIKDHNKSGVDPYILLCQIWKESGFDPNARGSNQDLGLMQLTPVAVKEVNRVKHTHFDHSEMTDPAKNVECGTLYLDVLLGRPSIDGDIRQALKEYNGSIAYADEIMSCAECMAGNWAGSEGDCFKKAKPKAAPPKTKCRPRGFKFSGLKFSIETWAYDPSDPSPRLMSRNDYEIAGRLCGPDPYTKFWDITINKMMFILVNGETSSYIDKSKWSVQQNGSEVEPLRWLPPDVPTVHAETAKGVVHILLEPRPMLKAHFPVITKNPESPDLFYAPDNLDGEVAVLEDWDCPPLKKVSGPGG